MRLKKGVILAGLDWRMRPALIVCQSLYDKYETEFVITSGLEGNHWAGSFHYYGLAIDIRTRDFMAITPRHIAEELSKILTKFDVIYESDHVHINYKKIFIDGNLR